MPLEIDGIRRPFPILSQQIEGNPLVYLDSAATAQKPTVVLDAMRRFYEHDNANAHRGMHVLAERATMALENARETVRAFLNASRREEIVFTKSCTEAINLVTISTSHGQLFQKGDAVIASMLEHHSNIVPWLQLKERKGVDVLWLDCDESGRLDLEQLKKFLAKGNVKLLSITAQSNVLGVRPPLQEMITLAHAAGALVLVDAAQSIAHMPTDVRALDCDFLAFSAHKLYGPTGIGVLYGKRALLESMPPFLGGGMMIRTVTTDGFTPADIPAKFEAGTPPVAEAVGLAAAIDWLGQYSWEDIAAHEDALIAHAFEQLSAIDGLRILGPTHPRDIHGCLSFVIDGIHPHDLTDILGQRGICLRAGHHCAQPLHQRLGVDASTRVSVGIYNSREEIGRMADAIRKMQARFR